MPLVAITPSPISSSFAVAVTLVKRRRKFAPRLIATSFLTSVSTVNRIRKIESTSLSFKSDGKVVPLKRNHRLAPQPVQTVFALSVPAVLYLNPMQKPEGTISAGGTFLAGQRLRAGDLYTLQVRVIGERLANFQIYFRAASTVEIGGKTLLISKSQGKGITVPVQGVDPETGKELVTANVFIYGTDTAAVFKETEFRFELEVDDGLGVRYTLKDQGSFSIYPDSPP
ncbi:MAG: hypothetical protein KME06_09455 [Kastovskya adunca ATA6-11-RM4]|jgi:hypothetical protein|nr:hypothetical protein [Kastovskya adunca ATA6-11-RM4]